jgi:nitrous oxide reductase accessory protein NosL
MFIVVTATDKDGWITKYQPFDAKKDANAFAKEHGGTVRPMPDQVLHSRIVGGKVKKQAREVAVKRIRPNVEDLEARIKALEGK